MFRSAARGPRGQSRASHSTVPSIADRPAINSDAELALVSLPERTFRFYLLFKGNSNYSGMNDLIDISV